MGKPLLFVLVFLVGCETTGTGTGPAATAAKRDKLEGIPLVWNPTASIATIGAVNLTGMTDVKVQVDRLGDKRDAPGLIGQNREKQPPRKVTTPDDVAGFVTDHIKALMRGGGLNVVDSGGSVTVNGEILQLFVDETDNYKGDVRINFTATNAAGKMLWSGVIGGSSTRFGRSYKDENYYETLSDSLIEATYNLLKTPGFHDAVALESDTEKCAKPSRDNATIAACTRLITSGQLTSADLAITFHNRGTARRDKGDYDGAIADYNEAIRLNPQYAKAYFNRGYAWDSKGDYDRAIADYNEAIRLNPQYVDAYNDRGVAWGNKGDYDRAIADYNEAIRLNPQLAEAFSNRGVVWGKKGDYDRAIADFNEAIRLNPQLAITYTNRGIAWWNKGDYDRAISDYNEAIRLNPQYALAYRNRGVTRFAQGQFESAEADFSAALRLNPFNAYSVIWRYFAQSRADHGAAAVHDLAPNAAKFDRAKWPAPVIDLLAGTTDVDSLLKAAASGDQKKQREQGCQAAFYIGEWHLLQGRRSQARASLERAERECANDSLEYFSASAELKRLSQ